MIKNLKVCADSRPLVRGPLIWYIIFKSHIWDYCSKVTMYTYKLYAIGIAGAYAVVRGVA